MPLIDQADAGSCCEIEDGLLTQITLQGIYANLQPRLRGTEACNSSMLPKETAGGLLIPGSNAMLYDGVWLDLFC